MVRLFVRIDVADHETWRKVYDDFYGERVDMVSWATLHSSSSTTRTT